MPSALLWTFLPTYLVQLWSTRSARAAANQFRQLMQKLFKMHSPSLKHQVHFLGGLWLLHLDASCCAVASSSHQGASPSQRKSFSLWLLLFRPSCCRQLRTSSGSWSNRILCHRAVTTVASTRDPRGGCQPGTGGIELVSQGVQQAPSSFQGDRPACCRSGR
ncbi:uncharacterized protein LOC144132631 [Amblyomma americanum]